MSDESKREILPINHGLPIQQAIQQISDALARIEGMAKRYNHTTHELDALMSGLGVSKFYNTRVQLGHQDSDYGSWIVHDPSPNGYNIWRYQINDLDYDINNQLREDDKIIDFRGLAVTDSVSPLSAVYLQSGGTYLDYTAEAASAEGTPFALLGSTSDELLIGNSTMFSGVDYEFFRPGNGAVLSYSYSKVDGWGSGATGTDILSEDNTVNFRRNGLQRFDFPGDFGPTSVNGSASLYWLRIQTSVAPSQVAQAYRVSSDSNVSNLLALSTAQLQAGVRAWAQYSNNIYVTIRSDGDPLYEGAIFLRSGSTANARKTFFSANHTYELDYKSNTYSLRLPTRGLLTFADDCSTQGSLNRRYVAIGGVVAGNQGHRVLRSGYLTGIAMSAGTAQTGSPLTVTVRKNNVDTIISGTLQATQTSAHRTDFTPQSFSAGDTLQAYVWDNTPTALDNLTVDIETAEVSP